MTDDTDTLTLVRESARAFAQRHQPELSRLQEAAAVDLPVGILDEIAELGWLDSLGDAGEPTTAGLLCALIFELARVSIPLGTRLLCHHHAREWLEAAREDGVASPHGIASWLSLPAFAPQPRNDELATMVVGFAESESLLWFKADDYETAVLLLVPRVALPDPLPVATLGLHGIGLVDIHIPATAVAVSTVICRGTAVQAARAVAWRRTSAAYVSLCRAVIATSLQTATSHAQCRHQGGARLYELPDVRAMLATMEQDHELARLVEHSLLASAPRTLLVPRVRQAMLTATDAGIQVLGGAGYVVGSGQERLWRDARQLATLFVSPWEEASLGK